jgi:hypothetical protein
MKLCPSCNIEKPFSEFHRNRRTLDGYTSWCKRCAIAHAAKWNREKGKQKRALWRSANRLRVKDQKIKTTFGLPYGSYDRMYQAQGGLCALCGVSRKTLFIDHSHTTRQVRALLCPQCNFAVGLIHDDPEMAERAAAYLRHWSH